MDDGGAMNAFVVAVTARVRAIVQESFIVAFVYIL